jgi:hypothetical protein
MLRAAQTVQIRQQFLSGVVLALRGNERGTGKSVNMSRRVRVMPITA